MAKEKSEELKATLARMDEAAREAKKDLLDNVSPEAVAEIGKWWDRHVGTCGHKRLGRIMGARGRKAEKAEDSE